uniref:U6 snRNA-associated Sm-like protein LSm8 n=1 Tax=Callorhinchus milii TaxID=7868 RepID=A0A4W3I451_CALMI
MSGGHPKVLDTHKHTHSYTHTYSHTSTHSNTHTLTRALTKDEMGCDFNLLGQGRKIGTLKGFDQTINLILDESHERVFSSQQGVEQVVLGLYIVRGDNVAVIGEIDEETDSALDLGNIRAEPLNSVVH